MSEAGHGGNNASKAVRRRLKKPASASRARSATAVTGCGFDTDGDFYAVEFSELGFESFAPETGALVRVPPHGSKPITVVSKLSFPNGFAARPHQIYTTNWSIAPASGVHGATGEVVRITH